MKNVLNFLWRIFKFLFIGFPNYLISSILIAVIVGLITWNIVYGFFTLLGLIILVIVYIFARQIYWWITSTGDYEGNNKKE